MSSNVMNTKEIGTNALKVWNVLNLASAGVSIQELCRQLAMSFSEVLDAIRWLSKERNIGLQMENDYLILIS